MDMQNSGGKCGCPHHKIVPGLVILIGLTFVLGNFNVIAGNTVSMIWPVLLTLIGVQKMLSGACKCCAK